MIRPKTTVYAEVGASSWWPPRIGRKQWLPVLCLGAFYFKVAVGAMAVEVHGVTVGEVHGVTAGVVHGATAGDVHGAMEAVVVGATAVAVGGEIAEDPGPIVARFGKNHLGDLDEHLPTNHFLFGGT